MNCFNFLVLETKQIHTVLIMNIRIQGNVNLKIKAQIKRKKKDSSLNIFHLNKPIHILINSAQSTVITKLVSLNKYTVSYISYPLFPYKAFTVRSFFLTHWREVWTLSPYMHNLPMLGFKWRK